MKPRHAAGRIRSALRTAAARLRTHARSLAQSAVAASLAYVVALAVLDRDDPFFAPIAAVVCLSVTVRQRAVRAAGSGPTQMLGRPGAVDRLTSAAALAVRSVGRYGGRSRSPR